MVPLLRCSSPKPLSTLARITAMQRPRQEIPRWRRFQPSIAGAAVVWIWVLIMFVHPDDNCYRASCAHFPPFIFCALKLIINAFIRAIRGLSCCVFCGCAVHDYYRATSANRVRHELSAHRCHEPGARRLEHVDGDRVIVLNGRQGMHPQHRRPAGIRARNLISHHAGRRFDLSFAPFCAG